MSDAAPGRVILVGGGPGDPDLLTIGGLKALRRADVVLYDHLAPLACLDEVRPGTVLVDVGKIPRGPQTPQEDINALLVEHARAGATVVRFKGGDAFVFGRGSEEWQACAAAGIPVEVIPGVSSAIAGPALAGIPLTHRGLSQSFTVVSGHVGPGPPRLPRRLDGVGHRQRHDRHSDGRREPRRDLRRPDRARPGRRHPRSDRCPSRDAGQPGGHRNGTDAARPRRRGRGRAPRPDRDRRGRRVGPRAPNAP